MKAREVRAHVEALELIDATDPERAHAQADEVLLAAVPKQVRDAYQSLIETAEWWASA